MSESNAEPTEASETSWDDVATAVVDGAATQVSEAAPDGVGAAELGPGDVGSEVLWLQERLVFFGYRLETTSIYDDATTAAVQQYQTAKSLTPTGVYDQDTREWVGYEWEESQVPEPGDTPTPGAAAQGTHVLKDADGNVLGYGTPKAVERQGEVESVDKMLRRALEEIDLVSGMLALADDMGCTVGFYVDADAGLMLTPLLGIPGVSGSLGVYVGPGRQMGWYSSVGADIGLIMGASAMVGSTVVLGGAENLGGTCLAFEVGASLPVPFLGVSGAILFTTDMEFLGIATEVGVSVGLPISIFGSVSNTTLHPI